MYVFLNHKLDPEGYAWPGEPVVEVTRCTDVSEETPFSSFISKVPNHCGTHMDAPRHFVKDGKDINELGMEYFVHDNTILLDIPKEAKEGITKEDLEPFADEIAKADCVLIRTGFEKYRDDNQDLYQNHGPYISPGAGRYLTDNFPNLKTIGMDFLAIGSADPDLPETDTPPECHRNLLGYYTGKFVTGIEDMHLCDIPKDAKIVQFINAPLQIKGLDSSQVTCIANLDV